MTGGARRVLAVAVALLAVACAAPGEDESGAHPLPPDTAPAGDTDGTGPGGHTLAPDPGELLGLGRSSATAPPVSTRALTLARDLGEDVDALHLPVPLEPPPTGTFKFITTTARGPVAFDACRPIHYRIRVGPGPAEGVALVNEALARVSVLSGLRFVFDGPLDVVPTAGTFPKPDSTVALKDAFAPVAIGWAERSETDLWASESADTLGVGGPRTIVFSDAERLTVSGFVLLSPTGSLKPGFGPGLSVGNVLLHEIGHLVGLDHVDVPHELMQPRLDRSTPDGYGAGDRRGLWELGASRGCASSNLRPSGP